MRAASELPNTGEGPLDIQDMAAKLYRERSRPSTDFKFLAVYYFVCTQPKFNAMLEDKGRTKRGPKQAVEKLSRRENDATPIDRLSETDSTPSRFMGQRKAKKARRAEDERSKDRQTLFELLRERNAMAQDANDLALAVVNLEAMPPSLRAIFVLKQAAMLKRLTADVEREADGGRGRGSASGRKQKRRRESSGGR